MLTLDEAMSNDDTQPFLKNGWHVVEFPTVGDANAGLTLKTHFAQGVDLPSIKFNPEPVFGGAKNNYYAGNQDIDQVTINFYENYKAEVTKYIMEWLGMIRRLDGIYSLPSEYKKSMGVELFDVAGQFVMRVELIDIWPIGGQQLTLDMSASLLTIPVTFAVDYVFYSS